MVDINNYYAHTGNLDFCLAPFNACEDRLSLDDIDCLENLDENDLLNFTNCDELNYSLLPDTPPETPINYNNNSNGPHATNLSDSPTSSGFNQCFNLTDNNFSLDSGVAFSPSSHLNIALASSLITNSHPHSLTATAATSPITNPTIIIPQSSVVQSATTIATCISPSSLVIPSIVNCQPVLSTVDLNGYQLNGNSLVYTKSIDSCSVSKSAIQPKSILPSQVSPKLAEQQKELFKKQTLEARKLRNREAALNSRLKKKEYVDALEENVQKLTKERDALLVENKLLKVKVKDLESQLSSCSKRPLDINGNYDSNKKVKMSYFAVVFMVFLQVSPYLIPGGPTEMADSTQLVPLKAAAASPNSPPKHIGRTLLWKRDVTSEVETDYISDRMKQANKGQFNSSSTVYANMTKSVLCKDYFNKTESMRLESELRDWLTRFQLEEKKLLLQQQQKQSNRKLKSNQVPRANKGSNNKRLLFDSKYVPIPRLKLWMQKQKYGGDYLSEQFEAGSSGSDDHSTGSAAESLFGLDYESLLATVHRRDDTFYYLSYPSKGHLILPPISNRSDVRPRFSFLIPTFHNLSLDESRRHSNANLNSSSNDAGNGNNSPQMFILQIDCQVINTKVILINDEAQGFGNKTKLRPPKMYKPKNINGGK